MKISCDIIRDILPLYAENMTSQASNDMVEEHLGECEGCTKYLGELKTTATIPGNMESHALIKVKKTIRKRTILTTVTTLFLIISILTGLLAWLYHPIWLSAEEAILSVEEVEHGGVQITYPGYVADTSRANAPTGIAHAAFTNHLSKIKFGVKKIFRPNDAQNYKEAIHSFIETPEHQIYPYHPELADKYGVMYNMTDKNHWYWNVYEARIESTLWDAGYPQIEDYAFQSEPKLTKPLFWTAVCILAVFGLLSVYVKRPKLHKGAELLSIMAGSFVLAALLMTDGRFFTIRWACDSFPILTWIWMLTVLFAVTSILVWKQIKIKKQDTL